MSVEQVEHARALDVLPARPGTYALVFHVREEQVIQVGRLGALRLTPGYYVYVGSARGPGGLAARVRRHLRTDKRSHWHIDYLTARVPPSRIVFSTHPEDGECLWVTRLLGEDRTYVPIRGFGNGDCHHGCPAHLLKVTEQVARTLPSLLAGDTRHMREGVKGGEER